MMVLVLFLATSIIPRNIINPTNITVYHEIPPQYERLELSNQDAGDIGGDLYFVMRGFSLPVECASKNPLASFDCDNPEENTASNVIAKHTVTVNPSYGQYGECNLADGQYTCRCGSLDRPAVPCTGPVGRADVSTRYNDRTPRGPNTENWQWWRVNLAHKTGGYWYSFFDVGRCNDTSENCFWKVVETVKTIQSSCLQQRVSDAVYKYNTECFEKCNQPKNTTSPCFVTCFMTSVLGPNGGDRVITPGEGMPLDVVTRAWNDAFLHSEPSLGGCPDVTF